MRCSLGKSCSPIFPFIYRRYECNTKELYKKGILADKSTILSNIRDNICNLHAYVSIIGADLAPKKTCFGEA